MLAINEFFENTWQVATSSGAGGLPPSVQQNSVSQTNRTLSNFGPVVGVTTVGVVDGLSTAFPVLVMADYSLWCPVLGRFVKPEETNLLTKLSE
jgi:hypothetical protein